MKGARKSRNLHLIGCTPARIQRERAAAEDAALRAARTSDRPTLRYALARMAEWRA